MHLLKFGGSSMGATGAIRQVLSIVKKRCETDQTVVVVSAMQGVTDRLQYVCDHADNTDGIHGDVIRWMEEKHFGVARELLPVQAQSDLITDLKMLINELEDVIQGIELVREVTPRTRDFILGFGERLSATILASLLQNEGVKAHYSDARKFLVTNDEYGNARVLIDESREKIDAHFTRENDAYVVTGFIGSTIDGVSTTVGRGGSDYTVAILGAALQAEKIEIWTDVNGLMTADPRKVSRAFPIREISYEEAMELSHFGAKVIYPPTLRPAMQQQIPILIKNTFNPAQEGTVIQKEIAPSQSLIKGLSSIGNVTLLTVKGSGMIGVSGIAARIFSALARAGVNIIMITQASSEHTITIAVLPHQAKLSEGAIAEEFKTEIQENRIDSPLVEEKLSIIAIVGDNMRNIPGIAGRVFRALGRNGINIRAIAQGSSERNISFVVDQTNEAKAMNTLHDAFFLSGVKTVNLYIVGVGLIGGMLLDMISDQLNTFYDDYQIDFRLRGVANSRKMLVQKSSISFREWEDQLDKHGEESSLDKFIDKMEEHNLPNSIFVDCTASSEVANIYPKVLNSSISIVTPNKKANSSTGDYYDRLQNLAVQKNVAFKYETNVGAGLPLLATIHELVSTGDKVEKIEGVLSGTLSYIFNSFDGSKRFSTIVKEAREKGYTEPDPREDLNGLDVARKLLILAREAGFKLEPDDLEVQNLVPKGARKAESVESFFEKLAEFDGEFDELKNKADAEDKKLCYIARFEKGKGNVKLESITRDHPFYGLTGSDNIVAIYTQYYRENPMVIKGPGAGAHVTAGGIVADILRVVNTKAASNAE